MSQQGQLFRLKRAGRDGEALWAYTYRVGGRDILSVDADRGRAEESLGDGRFRVGHVESAQLGLRASLAEPA